MQGLIQSNFKHQLYEDSYEQRQIITNIQETFIQFDNISGLFTYIW